MKLFASLLFVSASVASVASVYTYSIPEYSGPIHNPSDFFPRSAVSIGSFSWSIPAGETLFAAHLYGRFGNSQAFSTAGVDVYGDSTLVAQALPYGPEWFDGGPWSYQFSNLSCLMDGQLDLTGVQTNEYVVRLDVTYLELTTQAVPEPASLLVVVGGAVCLARRCKFRY